MLDDKKKKNKGLSILDHIYGNYFLYGIIILLPSFLGFLTFIPRFSHLFPTTLSVYGYIATLWAVTSLCFVFNHIRKKSTYMLCLLEELKTLKRAISYLPKCRESIASDKTVAKNIEEFQESISVESENADISIIPSLILMIGTVILGVRGAKTTNFLSDRFSLLPFFGILISSYLAERNFFTTKNALIKEDEEKIDNVKLFSDNFTGRNRSGEAPHELGNPHTCAYITSCDPKQIQEQPDPHQQQIDSKITRALIETLKST